MGFWTDFVAFNANAFYSITYFLWNNAVILLGFLGIGYCFFAEEVHTHEADIRDDRPII